MDINKALKKQRKSYKRFLHFMGFIFLLLPSAMLISHKENLFFLLFLLFIEFLIFIAVVRRTNIEKLEYKIVRYKICIVWGFFWRNVVIPFDKVVYVHTVNVQDDFHIVLMTNSKLRSKEIKPIGKTFMTRYPYLQMVYLKLKRKNPEEKFYYIVIKAGGFYKYQLLNEIYKTCVLAKYSDDAIAKIGEFTSNLAKDS